MSKTLFFYIIEHDGDTHVIADYELQALGKSKADVEKELGGKGSWLSMNLKSATARVEKEIRAKCLVGDSISGFKADESLFPAARFASVVEQWWKGTDAPSMSDFDDLPLNLADRVDYAIRRHLRPSLANVPVDFFTPKSEASTSEPSAS